MFDETAEEADHLEYCCEHFGSEECFKKEKEKLEVWVFNVFMVWINM